jgi:hypothetical protein
LSSATLVLLPARNARLHRRVEGLDADLELQRAGGNRTMALAFNRSGK